MGIIEKCVLFLRGSKIWQSYSDINKGVAECLSTPGALLVDVREADEYASGHIAGAVNLPLSFIGNHEGKEIAGIQKNVPLFLYCLRGSRSRRAEKILKQMGYEARNIGGIKRYKGEMERSGG